MFVEIGSSSALVGSLYKVDVGLKLNEPFVFTVTTGDKVHYPLHNIIIKNQWISYYIIRFDLFIFFWANIRERFC
jgi:hypothetical protein